MRFLLMLFLRAPRTIASALFLVGLGIFNAGSEPSTPRSDNPWNKNYDAAAKGSHAPSGASRSREGSGVRFETVYVDKDGVIHDKDDLKAYDPSEIEIR